MRDVTLDDLGGQVGIERRLGCADGTLRRVFVVDREVPFQLLTIERSRTFVLVAKALLYDDADVGFFLATTYDELASDVLGQLRVLVRSEISVISHLFLVHPGSRHWPTQEEVEFMIDLMHALES